MYDNNRTAVTFYDDNDQIIKDLSFDIRALFVDGNGSDGRCILYLVYEWGDGVKPFDECFKRVSYLDIICAHMSAVADYKVDRYTFIKYQCQETRETHIAYELEIKYIGSHTKLMCY